jgi:uncharacterized protein YggT (Ycf19 family)
MNLGTGRELFSSSHLVVVIDPLSQILVLARFLCFMAIFYLALHKLVSRLSHKPNSKLLWFFSVLTTPLTRPVRAWITPGASDDQLLSRSLLVYGFLWLCLVLIGRMS